MMLHKVSARTECEIVLHSKQFEKLLINCFTTGMWIVS